VETLTHGTGERAVTTRLLMACGVVAPLLNSIVILVLGALRPGYNAWTVPDSDLELGDGGWMQITNYIVTGALLLAFAIGMRRLLRTGPGSTWGPVLLGVYGLTFIVIGPVLPDPSSGYPPGASSALTVHGVIHILFGLIQFSSLVAACFVLARRGATSERRGWYRYSVATGLLVAGSYVAFVLASKLLDGAPTGLIERIGIIGGSMWIALLAVRLASRSVPGVPSNT
jgi:hypothetical protein